MSESLGSAVMTFGGDDREFQGAADRVEGAMRNLAGFMGDTARTIEEGFKSVAGSVDKAGDSVVSIGNFFRGRILANGLAEMAKAAADFRKEIDLGHASVQDMLRGIVDKIPIVGQFAQAGRGIREAFTGEDASFAVIKQATEEQEKRADLTDRLILSMRTLRREQLETQRQLDAHPGDTFSTLVGRTVDRGESAATKIKQDTEAAHKAEFDAIDKQKIDLQEKIRSAVDAIMRHTNPSGEVGKGDPRNVTSREIEEWRTQFRALEKQSSDLRAQIDATVRTAEEKIGHATFRDIGRLFGGELADGIDKGRSALARWVAGIPEVNRETQKMLDGLEARLQSTSANIGKFKTEINGLQMELAKGTITPEVFQKLTDKSWADQIARTFKSIFDQYAPIVEMIARITDANIGGPFRSLFGSLGQLGQMFTGKMNLKEPKEAKVPEFRARWETADQMWHRIQAAAASGTPGSDPVQDGILAAVKATSDEAKRQSELLSQIAKKKDYAVVGP